MLFTLLLREDCKNKLFTFLPLQAILFLPSKSGDTNR